jgi:FkbM family methyltransferase
MSGFSYPMPMAGSGGRCAPVWPLWRGMTRMRDMFNEGRKVSSMEEKRSDQIKLRHFNTAPALAALSDAGIVWFRDVDITAGRHDGQRVLFATDKEADPIQRAHRNASFYEAEELAMLRAHVKRGATFVDIGANVGNHTLYAAMFLGAARVIPVEPNPLALRLLLINVMMNGIEDRVITTGLGLGLGARAAEGFGMESRHKNLGAAKMLDGAGDIAVITGDTLLAAEKPDFIKIDVEGMEMDALSGLAETIARCRPRMLVEVDQQNYDAFDAWCAETGYTVVETIQRYATNKNFLLKPVAKTTKRKAKPSSATRAAA